MIFYNLKSFFFILLPISLYLVPTKFIFTENHVPICLFRLLFDKECWGCGTTRSIFSLLYFRFEEAYTYNKLIVIIAPLIAFLWIREIYRTYKKLRPRSNHPEMP